jgi:hypothetical protein
VKGWAVVPMGDITNIMMCSLFVAEEFSFVLDEVVVESEVDDFFLELVPLF